MRALDDMENANAQVEVSVEEVTKARTQKIKVFHLLICCHPLRLFILYDCCLMEHWMKASILFAFIW
jgi:t-SNARE complex subunit (syntaxin)